MVEIQKKQNNQTFDEQVFTELTTFKIQKEKAIEQSIGQVESMKQTLLDLEQKWIEKVKLQEELNQVDARKTDLRTLSNLFQGQGFVNYISGVYLSQLCDLANARFHQLTQNKLSLILNEKNNFEVIDYLNEGHVRSVKTLSGGQSFQASLCLALALAESVQSLNQSEKNFFFIDEGFGTQDTESIHVIYETLSQLHKENRVVGVISHFEELQERITNHIQVVNDVNLGSQVLVS
jgi:exonuclease SbcC